MEQNPFESPPVNSAPPKGIFLSRIGLGIACAMFLLSLCGSAIISRTGASFGDMGINCLLLGMGYLAWYANPYIFLAGLSLFKRWHLLSVGCAAIAIVLSLTALRIREIEINEAGIKEPVTGYGWGYYLWLGSSITLLLTALACLAFEREKSN